MLDRPFFRTSPFLAQEARRGRVALEPWVLETPASGKDALFAVYDRDGRLLGEIAPPSGVTILELGDSYMMACGDGDNVEPVRVYALTKP